MLLAKCSNFPPDFPSRNDPAHDHRGSFDRSQVYQRQIPKFDADGSDGQPWTVRSDDHIPGVIPAHCCLYLSQMTHSVDSFITDSANSATALYTGKKSTVNALGVYADSVSPC